MIVEACSSYQAEIDDFRLVRKADGKSVFKIYYCSISGRPSPERYEWARCKISKDQFASDFAASAYEGIGFVTAFPHIAKVFRFAPKAEVLEHVCAFKPEDGSVISLVRDDGFYEFACLAEAVLANDEFKFWAEAGSVQEYLLQRSEASCCKIGNHGKLKQYWMN
ncbi:MAG: hypothetical protein PHY82_12335 [Lentisphaeria bacterium]|jgi:hypothetical protein|nr:hypothetical protein [Lentisphaeria bacterium]